MSYKLLKVLLAGLLVALLVVTPALAAVPAAPATGMAAAAGPLPEWVTVEPGATQWYKFKYTYVAGKEDDDPFPALVELRTAAPANVAFEIWTPGRLNAPLPDPEKSREDQEHAVREPVGMGTPQYVGTISHWQGTPEYRHTRQVFDQTHLVWLGSAKATDTYYIVVKNKGAEAASYKLNVSGATVSF